MLYVQSMDIKKAAELIAIAASALEIVDRFF